MSKFCQNCGAQLEDGAKFCGKCGTKIGPQTINATYVSGIAGSDQKSRLVAGLLGLFLGAWGIHNFYLGYTSKGVTQIFLTIVTCGIAAIWGFIEGILILCGSINVDANGQPLGN